MKPQVQTDIEARVRDTGDIMTGVLKIQTPIDQIPSFELSPSVGTNGSTYIYKNASSTKDYGSHFVDSDKDGNSIRLTLIANRKNDFANSAYFQIKDPDGNASKYVIYHTGYKPSASDINALSLNGGTMLGTINSMNIIPKSDHSYELGSTSKEFKVVYSRLIFARHIDSSNVYSSDKNLYIGYGSNLNPTNKVYLYSSKLNEDNSSITRTLNATSELSGFRVHTYLGVNGLSTSYRFYCNGNSYFTNSMTLNTGTTSKIIFSIKNTQSNGVSLTADSEGGNICVYSGNGNTNWWELDSFNGNFRWVSWLSSSSYKTGPYINKDTCALYGAVWNDYAEYRAQETTIQPGYCVRSQRNGKLLLTTERLSPCEGVVSDTFGFAIGETEESQTPIAVSGRVLVYVSGNRDDYEIGDCLCAGPGGLAYKMTREEIKEYPDRIIGTVSEIPEYEIWGTGEISVNERIWINVK